MSQQAAKRRRRQFSIKFRHPAKLGRPVYKLRSADKLRRKLEQRIAVERAIQSRGKKR